MTYREWIESLEIFSKYAKNGMDSYATIDATHDRIFGTCGEEKINVESEDGKRLTALGWSIDPDCDVWATGV